MVTLNTKSLHSIEGVLKPNYDQSNVQAGILHLGLGNFHRAHQAVYLENLFNQNSESNWGIISSITRTEQADTLTKIAQQDNLYTLQTISPQGLVQYQIIGSILKTIDGSKTPQNLLPYFAFKNIRIISLTITEGGYYFNTEEQNLMVDHPAIQADIQGDFQTVYSYLYQGLKRRKQHCNQPITLLSCDNLRMNGEILKLGFFQFLEVIQDFPMIEWCSENISFPNSMVDRITPKSEIKVQQQIQTTFQYQDQAALNAESYIQWVLEDQFIAGRPNLESVGVEFVEKVHEKEETKIRILNGGHVAVAWKAILLGYHWFHEAMENEELSKFLDEYILYEVLPTLDFVHSFNLEEYYQIVKSRFCNPYIPDTMDRLAAEGISRIPKFILPVIYDCMQKQIPCPRAFEILANWFQAIQYHFQDKLFIIEQETKTLERWFHNSNPLETWIEDQTFWGYPLKFQEEFKKTLFQTCQNTLLIST